MSRLRDRAWPPSRIGLRLLAFNLLVVFVPVVGILYLDVYEARLLQAQEREMVQQGRLLAAAAVVNGSLDPESITRTLTRLERQSEARLRVYDARGSLLGDSARISVPSPRTEQPYGAVSSPGGTDVRSRLLYRLGAWIVRVRQRAGALSRAVLRSNQLERPAEPAAGTGLEPEVRAALDGQYGAAARQTPGQRSLTLFSAVPIRVGSSVVGAVVVSQSTFRVLQAIYDVRLRIFQVVVTSIMVAALLTTVAAMTIVRPLRRLRRTASALAERRGPLPVSFPGTARKDELGDLARALEELTRRLNGQIGLLEGFAADVSHEFKNPLASIRTAAEMVGESERPEDRQRFLTLMLRDVDRLERLVSGVREMARIDGELEHEGHAVVILGDVLKQVVDRTRSMAGDRTISVDAPGTPIPVRGSHERLAQVFENLLSNAISFAPAGSTVEIAVTARENGYAVTVSDRGPGIPDAHLERIFERFFTYRPVSGRGDHLGLGLAIVRRIVEGHGGSITARQRQGGGSTFEVRLRAAIQHSAFSIQH
ncbi:MAG TPA: stimulus-sensing domain-containing protein [Vicinamibacterales bacterium]|nr:stimulus-sensing domain-containing protein [Vicinamibacterales bacterium]